MAGAAYGKQIVPYSVPPTAGDAYFNSFDTAVNRGHIQPPVQCVQYEKPQLLVVQQKVQYDPQYSLAYAQQPNQGCIRHDQGGYQPPTFVLPPPSVSLKAREEPSPYRLFRPAVPASELVDLPMSATACSSPDVSPSSYRDSSYPPGSSESSNAKPDKTSVP
ncbi:hypothetical protein BGZ96_010373 [Linnemannia gamsii]|uniref:Uncharacterized protein n=1 Tax=Linnemannia gamsii TaxID=64522 RepID=A0ABQ7JUS9_9FUNG|nr:hypothetical protein BGZ96_010373 [Linnemannia gamsii]